MPRERRNSNSVSSLGSSVSEHMENPLLKKIRDEKKIAVSSEPKQPTDSTPQKTVTFGSIHNFFAGFSKETAVRSSEQKTTSPPHTPLSPLSSTPYTENDSSDTPLLHSSSSDHILVTADLRPTTVIEILQLDPQQIERLLTQVTEETQRSYSPAAKRYLILLYSITIAAILMEPFFSLWLRKGIEENNNYWFTKGYTRDLTVGAAYVSLISAWAFAVFNVVVDMLAVNPIEEAFKLFNNLLQWCKKAKDISGQRMFYLLAEVGLLFPVSLFLSAAAVDGLTGIADVDNTAYKVTTTTIMEFLGVVYFWMFSFAQFEKHLDAVRDSVLHFCSFLWSSISRGMTPTPTEAKHPSSPQIKKKKKASRRERLEDLATYAEMFRILANNYAYRTLSALLPFIEILAKTLKLKDSPAKTKAIIIGGIISLLVAALTRTLQTTTSMLNKDFNQLTRKENREAKVGRSQQLTNIIMTAISAGSTAALVYKHGSEDNLRAAILAAGSGVLSAFITGMVTHRHSKRTAALEAKKQAKKIISSNPSLTAENLYLHQVMVMSREEIFNAVIKKVKADHWIKWIDYLNFLARTSRVMVTGNFINSVVGVLNDYGINTPIDFIDQLIITLFFAVPVQIADFKVFREELVGEKLDDAKGHIPYLLAKYKITGLRGFVPSLPTPKKHFPFPLVFKAFCKLDEALNNAFEAFKSSLPRLDNPPDDGTLILSLRQQIKNEYKETIHRLREWVTQGFETELENSLQDNPEFAPYMERLKCSDQHFIGKDYLILKEMENCIFQPKMDNALLSVAGGSCTSLNPHDATVITENEHLSLGNYLISKEALDFIQRFEQTPPLVNVDLLSADNDGKERKLPSTTPTINKSKNKKQRFFGREVPSDSDSVNSSSRTAEEPEGQEEDKKSGFRCIIS